jgi:hypothetical protein
MSVCQRKIVHACLLVICVAKTVSHFKLNSPQFTTDRFGNENEANLARTIQMLEIWPSMSSSSLTEPCRSIKFGATST